MMKLAAVRTWGLFLGRGVFWFVLGHASCLFLYQSGRNLDSLMYLVWGTAELVAARNFIREV